jgi:tRNA A37 N6-isopentenylltransferase MiaA
MDEEFRHCANCSGEFGRRDELAYRKLRGETLTEDEQQLLERLNRRGKARMREGLPDDVKKMVEELLDQ